MQLWWTGKGTIQNARLYNEIFSHEMQKVLFVIQSKFYNSKLEEKQSRSTFFLIFLLFLNLQTWTENDHFEILFELYDKWLFKIKSFIQVFVTTEDVNLMST